MANSPFTIDITNEGRHQQLLEGEPITKGMKSGRLILEPGDSCSEHSTHGKEEQLVFFAGKGKLVWGEDKNECEIGAGKILYIPPHTIHSIHNSGDEALIYIYCVTPVAGE